jgi:hypothetical protein
VIDAAKTYGRVVLAKAYAAIQWGRPVNSGVIDLEHVGFEAVHRCVSPKDGNGKKDIDSLLLTDMIVAAYENVADTFLLASGDSDYVPAIRTIRRLGKKVVVMSYPAQMSPRLLAIADEAISMIPPCEVKDPGNESCAMPPAIRDSTWSRDCGVPVDGSAGVKG